MFGVFAVEFKQVLLKNKFKDSSEGLSGDRGVFPIVFSCGIFVYKVATSKETRKASSGWFLLSQIIMYTYM